MAVGRITHMPVGSKWQEKNKAGEIDGRMRVQWFGKACVVRWHLS